jgi:hypothetical protein
MMTPRSLCAVALMLAACGATSAQVVVATYEFQNSYAADESGKPALNPYAPGAGTLSFTTDTVNVGSQSVTRTVLGRGGTTGAAQTDQAGVELNTGTLLTNPNMYSIDMVFSMTTNSGGYQRLVNTNNGIDGGLYALGLNAVIYPARRGPTRLPTARPPITTWP